MQLKKELGTLDVFCISTGAMISSELFLLPGLAYAQVGPSVIVCYLLAGVLAIAGLLSQAELATAMPKSGGTYFYVMRSMGPGVGMAYGLITVLALVLKSAFALVGFGIVLRAVLLQFDLDFNTRAITVILCLVFLTLNAAGAREAVRLQIALVFCIIAMLLIYVFVGLPHIQLQNYAYDDPVSFISVFSTAGFVFVSYGGLLKVASIAEEIKNPGRSLPLGMVLSLIVVAVIYAIVLFVTIGLLGGEQLVNSTTPISDGAAISMGMTGWYLLAIAGFMAFSTASNAGIMAASRYPLALSRDDLLPEFLGRINEKFKTPHNSIVLVGIIILIALFLDLNILVKFASSVLILTFIFSCLAVVILRESRLQNYQPSFRSPLYPWVQIIGTLGFVFFLVEMGWQTLLFSAVLIVIGLFLYWFFSRIKVTREYALLHLIERITSKELTDHSLETELKEIVRERDEILKDRFDHVIEDAIVLDIEKSITLDEMFQQVAEELSPRLHLSSEEIIRLLSAREEESSTVLNRFLAIPHIVIEGEKAFEILMVRCREGIVYSEAYPQVHTVFVLIGSKDERTFHLLSLAAICQIVQDIDFDDKWMNAKGVETLRDIVLLGKRKRHIAQTPSDPPSA
jgi:basic amino acid/polyamine antiporter, APA family